MTHIGLAAGGAPTPAGRAGWPQGHLARMRVVATIVGALLSIGAIVLLHAVVGALLGVVWLLLTYQLLRRPGRVMPVRVPVSSAHPSLRLVEVPAEPERHLHLL
jgi:hypothetical protein